MAGFCRRADCQAQRMCRALIDKSVVDRAQEVANRRYPGEAEENDKAIRRLRLTILKRATGDGCPNLGELR